MLKCPPPNIIKKTDKKETRVIWEEPEYSDNCGSYEECPLSIFTATPNNSPFLRGSTTKVVYTATDPSGNKNEKCIFNVIIKCKLVF